MKYIAVNVIKLCIMILDVKDVQEVIELVRRLTRTIDDRDSNIIIDNDIC